MTRTRVVISGRLVLGSHISCTTFSCLTESVILAYVETRTWDIILRVFLPNIWSLSGTKSHGRSLCLGQRTSVVILSRARVLILKRLTAAAKVDVSFGVREGAV